MEKTLITIPHWRKSEGTEAEVKWITLKDGRCEERRNLVEFFKLRGQQHDYKGFLRPNLVFSEMFASNDSLGMFATYERNYSYLEDKGDVDTETPTEDDLFRVAGFSFGMPYSKERLEQILKKEDLHYLFASGSHKVFYYETWVIKAYEKILRKPLEDFIFNESRKMSLDCVTAEVKTIETKVTNIVRNMNYAPLLSS